MSWMMLWRASSKRRWAICASEGWPSGEEAMIEVEEEIVGVRRAANGGCVCKSELVVSQARA